MVLRISGSKGQIWVESVIYTLIGVAIIGLMLVIAKPKIDEKKDGVIIDQAIESLTNFDNKLYEVQKSDVGNRRSMDLEVSHGKVVFDLDDDSVSWILDSSFMFSQEDVSVPLGRINVTTTKANPWEVTLTLYYPVEISYNDELTGTKEFIAAPTPYRFSMENEGVFVNTGKLKVNLQEGDIAPSHP